GEQAIEIFCNHAAGAALVPSGSLLKAQTVLAHGESPEWEDEEIEILAHTYSVTVEVLVRRLLTLRLTTKTFYEKKRPKDLREFGRGHVFLHITATHIPKRRSPWRVDTR